MRVVCWGLSYLVMWLGGVARGRLKSREAVSAADTGRCSCTCFRLTCGGFHSRLGDRHVTAPVAKRRYQGLVVRRQFTACQT